MGKRGFCQRQVAAGKKGGAVIIPVRDANGQWRTKEDAWVSCPWSYHYHSGSEVEIEAEMILCRYDAEMAISGLIGQ